LRRRAELEAKVANLTEAIATGGLRGSSALAAAFQSAEAELAALAPVRPSNVARLWPTLEADYRRMVADLPKVLTHDADRARAILARILGEIRLVRTPDNGLVARIEMQPGQLLELVEGRNCGNGSGGRI
jgi:hypothetical protein